MAANLFEQVDAGTAEEFLDFFVTHRQSRVLWGRSDEDHWMFRGVRRAAWTLEPSAFRVDEAGNNAFVQFWRGQEEHGPFDTIADQLKAEHHWVLRFANWVSELGFEVPGDRPELRSQELPQLLPHPGDGRDFPALHFRWLYALAQHYGIPTRLLDWTMNPLCAAYFAALDAAALASKGPIPSEERIAVWALSRKFVDEVARATSSRLSPLTFIRMSTSFCASGRAAISFSKSGIDSGPSTRTEGSGSVCIAVSRRVMRRALRYPSTRTRRAIASRSCAQHSGSRDHRQPGSCKGYRDAVDG